MIAVFFVVLLREGEGLINVVVLRRGTKGIFVSRIVEEGRDEVVLVVLFVDRRTTAGSVGVGAETSW